MKKTASIILLSTLITGTPIKTETVSLNETTTNITKENQTEENHKKIIISDACCPCKSKMQKEPNAFKRFLTNITCKWERFKGNKAHICDCIKKAEKDKPAKNDIQYDINCIDFCKIHDESFCENCKKCHSCKLEKTHICAQGKNCKRFKKNRYA